MPDDILQRVAVMARMQNEHNLRVHPQWRDQGHEYFRAIWVECAELLDHFGWKWWKYQQPDLEQVRLEIVDIWHFGLSELLRSGRIEGEHCDPDVIDTIVMGLGEQPGDFRECVERLAANSLTGRGFDLEGFLAVLVAMPMSFEELFQGYVGKNVLNNFRQNHGYQSGEYLKIWQGREDNEHLMELIADLNQRHADFADQLYQALEVRYQACAGSGQVEF
jgi:hypothetical protein